MDWLAAFFAWLLGLPRTARLAAMARTYINGVLHDLEQARSLSPAADQSLRRNCGALLFTAHTLVAAHILCRAREIAGLKAERPHMDWTAIPRRLASRESLAKRATELLRRLDRAETHARKLAETLTTSELEDLTGTLSTRVPREGGGPDSRASANILYRLLRALRARPGRPPARATRLIGLATRAQPAARAPPYPCPQGNRPHLTLCRTAA